MKGLISSIGAVLTALSADAGAHAEPPPPCPIAGYEYDSAASDEFNGSRLDDARWDDWVWSFQGRRQGFLFARDNVSVANGCLNLTARALREDEKTVENGRRGFDKYATALVKAKRKTHYGYYECRAKTMKACVCNAFWLYDPLSDSPAKFRPGDFSEEIDIFEIFGAVGRDEKLSKPSVRTCYHTVHCLATPYLEATCNGGVEKLPERTASPKFDFDFWADYHVFGFLWTEKELVWFVDGKETFRRANDRFHRPLHLTFDCEVMFTWTGEPRAADLPAVYSIDYFRYWRPRAPVSRHVIVRDFRTVKDGRVVNFNIGTAAHGPSTVAQVRKYLPGAKVTVWADAPLSDEMAAMMRRRFPDVPVVWGAYGPRASDELKSTVASADLLLIGSSSTLTESVLKSARDFRAATGRRIGCAAMGSSHPVHRGFDFGFFRDERTLAAAEKAGDVAPVHGYAPDSVFDFDCTDEAGAAAFLKRHGLARGQFVCAIPGNRFTPRWEFWGGPANEEFAAVNARTEEPDNAVLRAAIVEIVRKHGLKVLVCAEQRTEVALGKRAVMDRLPADVRANCVWTGEYWSPDLALSVYRASRLVFGIEMHSQVMALGNGVPAVILHHPNFGAKADMWRTIGCIDWSVDLTKDDAATRAVQVVSSILTDEKAAQERVGAVRRFLDAKSADMYAASACLATENAVEVQKAIDAAAAVSGGGRVVDGVGQPPMIGALGNWSMLHCLKEAGIPYSRLHDVGGWQGSGLYADIPDLFPDFDADENGQKSYRVVYTDNLVKALVDHGVERRTYAVAAWPVEIVDNTAWLLKLKKANVHSSPSPSVFTSSSWPGFSRGMGFGGCLANYQRFTVLPENKRLLITEGRL